jgi:hypothetical protein
MTAYTYRMTFKLQGQEKPEFVRTFRVEDRGKPALAHPEVYETVEGFARWWTAHYPKYILVRAETVNEISDVTERVFEERP